MAAPITDSSAAQPSQLPAATVKSGKCGYQKIIPNMAGASTSPLPNPPIANCKFIRRLSRSVGDFSRQTSTHFRAAIHPTAQTADVTATSCTTVTNSVVPKRVIINR